MCDRLIKEDQYLLLKILPKYENLSVGKLEEFKMDPLFMNQINIGVKIVQACP
jgi:hypothetical protein